MTVEHRDFDAGQPLAEPSGTFTLGGRQWRVRNKDDVPFSVLAAFDAQAGQVKVEPFFRATIHPDDLDGFLTVVNDPAGPLTKRKIGDLIDYVTGLVLGRPTQPARGSSPGSKNTRRKSTAGSSSRVTPSRRSA